MTLNEILESIGNRTVTWKYVTDKLSTSGWASEPAIKHLLKTELLVKVDKGLYKVGERFKLKPKPLYKPEPEPTRTVNAMSLDEAIELCRSHGIDCSRVTSVNHGNVRVVTRVIL
jgi:hypothetical protein